MPTWDKVNYPIDIINYLVAADKLQEVNKDLLGIVTLYTVLNSTSALRTT